MVLLGFSFLTLFRTFCDLDQINEFRATFEFFSKRSKIVWEYRRDHMENHSSGESAQLEKFSEVLSAYGFCLLSNN